MKIKSLLLRSGVAAAALTVVPLTSYADDYPFDKTGETFTVDEINYAVLTNGTVVVSGYGSAVPSDLVIPESVTSGGTTYTVTGIDDWAIGYGWFDSITLPSTLKAIGGSAFTGINVTELEIPEGVTYIGDNAFAYSSLKSMTLPSTLVTLGSYTFNMCNDIEKIVFPSSLKVIPQSCADSCPMLEDITLPEGIEEIGIYAFVNCAKITTINLPTTCKRVLQQAFENTSFTELTIPANVEYLGNGCFGYNNFLPDVKLTIADAETPLQLEGYPFGSLDVTNFYCGRDVTGETLEFSVANTARFETGGSMTRLEGFRWGMPSLSELILGEGLEFIGVQTFLDSPLLTELTLPGSLKEMGKYALSDLKGLKKLVFADGDKPLNFLETPMQNSVPTEVYLGRVLEGDKSTLDLTKVTDVTFGPTLTEIPTDMFKNSRELVNVTARAAVPPVLSIDALPDKTFSVGTLYTDEQATADYVNAEGWEEFNNIYGAQVTVKVSANEGGVVIVNGNSNSEVAVERNAEVEASAVADAGYALKSITLNGKVLAVEPDSEGKFMLPALRKDATLEVVFEKLDGIAVVSDDSSNVSVNGLTISVTGVDCVTIVNVDGRVIYSGADTEVTLPAAGIYLVKTGTTTIKVVVK